MISHYITSILIFLVTFCSFTFGEEDYKGAYHIFPADGPITVKTREGYHYTHIEGDHPDWKVGVLKNVIKEHVAIPGNGYNRTFNPTIGLGYHYIEEILSEGIVHLELDGKFKTGFSYIFRQGNVTIAEGEIAENELSNIPPIILPFGDYTFQAIAEGYITSHPVDLTLHESNSPLEFTVTLDRNHALVRVLAHPHDLSFMERATVRRINVKDQTVEWQQDIELDHEYFPLKEGQYTIEFPNIEGYDAPGKNNILGRFNFIAKDSPYEIIGKYTPHHGTLIVRYNTGPKRERLDRVRFWLLDANNNRTMYPKAEGTQSLTTIEQEHEVIIEGLNPGKYAIEFLVPNADALFKQVPNSEILIEKGEIYTLHQSIEPLYGSIHAIAKIENDSRIVDLRKDIEDVHDQADIISIPNIIILDKHGDRVGHSTTGRITLTDLLPGEYAVVFGEIEGYNTPRQIFVTVNPDDYIGPIIGEYVEESARLFIKSNRINQRWTLSHESIPILEGMGSSGPYLLSPNQVYTIDAEELEDFDLVIKTGDTFTMPNNSELEAVIMYTRNHGTLTVNTEIHLVDGDTATFTIIPHDGREPISQTFNSSVTHINWAFDRFPAGAYTIEYNLPPYYTSHPPQNIVIKKDDDYLLEPTFTGSRSIFVNTNFDEATFTLGFSGEAELLAGSGERFAYSGLLPGDYTLVFSALDPSGVIMPEPVIINVSPDDDVGVNIRYLFESRLRITSNVNDYKVKIIPLEEQDIMRTHYVEQRTIMLSLPAGLYRLEFNPLEGEFKHRYADNHPDPIDVILKPREMEVIHAAYEANRGRLIVTTNIDHASYTVTDISGGENLLIGTFHGAHTVIPLTFVGHYRVVFDPIPNYITPNSVVVIIEPNGSQTIGGTYLSRISAAHIPGGPSIIGDTFGDGGMDERPSRTIDISPFSISSQLVTNAQFAAWLTKAHNAKQVQYLKSSGVRGQIVDTNGHLLFETRTADRDSQIERTQTESGFAFIPIRGKENFPVIEVSWYGAMAYCKSHGYRLATEAEWEKAAAMAASSPNVPMKKYRYGFSSNDIHPTKANYTIEYAKGRPYQIETRPVGFYNGINMLKYDQKSERKLYDDPSTITSSFGTTNAKSPYGAYDMSGNVREWVSDWYDPNYYKFIESLNPKGPGHGTLKVTKGGSYNSVAHELRASSRIPLFPETTDAFTGFRIVIQSEHKL